MGWFWESKAEREKREWLDKERAREEKRYEELVHAIRRINELSPKWRPGSLNYFNVHSPACGYIQSLSLSAECDDNLEVSLSLVYSDKHSHHWDILPSKDLLEWECSMTIVQTVSSERVVIYIKTFRKAQREGQYLEKYMLQQAQPFIDERYGQIKREAEEKERKEGEARRIRDNFFRK